jgi:hypothetical protein
MTSIDSQRVPLFQVTADQGVRGTGNPDEQQRFLGEVKFVDYFAQLIGTNLGMQSLELAVVEDSQSQTAIYYAPPLGGAPSVNGFISTKRRSLSELVETLREEHRD